MLPRLPTKFFQFTLDMTIQESEVVFLDLNANKGLKDRTLEMVMEVLRQEEFADFVFALVVLVTSTK